MQRLAQKKGEGDWIGLECVGVGVWGSTWTALQRPLLSLLEFNSNDQTGLCVYVCGGSFLLQGL